MTPLDGKTQAGKIRNYDLTVAKKFISKNSGTWKSHGLTGGMPACNASSAAASAVNGVSSEGFTTTVHPAANAGATCDQ